MTERSEVIAKAMHLRQWAESAGVFSQGRSTANVSQLDALAASGMFAAGAAEAFIAKPITAVGFAASDRKEPRLFIYTRRRLTIAEQKVLSGNETGVPIEFRVAQPFSISTPTIAARFPAMFRDGRLTCGSSVSIGNAREAGTMEAILQDKDGTLYGLSCNHVTGGCSNARAGTPIVAPGILDVGANAPYPRTVGLHETTLPFVPGDPSAIRTYRDNHDAATFRLIDPTAVTSFQGDAYDTPGQAADPEEDAPIEKVSRTTLHTRGYIESRLVGPQRVDYSLTVYHSAEESIAFRGTVFFDPIYIARGLDGVFAAEGDSGALVVTRGEGREPLAVGIVIGGRGEEAYVAPLKPVLDKLGLTLVTEHRIA